MAVSRTFDEDAELNRTQCQMKAAERKRKTIGIQRMCLWMDMLTAQLSKLVSIYSTVLFTGTKKCIATWSFPPYFHIFTLVQSKIQAQYVLFYHLVFTTNYISHNVDFPCCW